MSASCILPTLTRITFAYSEMHIYLIACLETGGMLVLTLVGVCL